MNKKIRVAIIEDNRDFREPLVWLINKSEKLSLFNEYSNGLSFIKEIDGPFKPDVCLIDVVLPDISGLECARIIKSKYPHIHIVIMTSFSNSDILAEVKSMGVDFVEKGPRMVAFIENLLETVSLSNTEHFISYNKEVNNLDYIKLSKELEEVQKRLSSLSKNQYLVLNLKRKGLTAKEIAKDLNMTEGTVQTHIKRAMAKLKLPNLLDYLFGED